MIDTRNIEEAKKEIKKSKEKIIIVKAQDDNFNRKILEYGKFNVLLSPESGERKDKIKSLDSGLNNVLLKIAAKNKVSVGIDLSGFDNLSKKEKAIKLSKIIRNIKLCRKNKVPIYIKGDKKTTTLLFSLGASSQQASETL